MAKFNELIKEYHETIKLCHTEPSIDHWRKREEIWRELCSMYYTRMDALQPFENS